MTNSTKTKPAKKPKSESNGRTSALISFHPDVLAWIDQLKDARQVHRGVIIDEKFWPEIESAKAK